MTIAAGPDHTPAGRAQAAAVGTGSGLELTEVSPSSDVMRQLENVALLELDSSAARRMTDLDRRFARATSKLGSELARRQDSVERNVRPRQPVTLDVWAFLCASVGIALLLAGGRGGPSVPTDAALAGAAALGVAAAVFHTGSFVGAARTKRSGTQSWYLVLLSTGLLVAAAAAGYWRYSMDPQAGFVVAAVALGVLISAGVFVLVLLIRGNGARAAEAREDAARRERDAALRADLDTQLTELISTCRSEAETIVASLGADQRAALDAAVAAGVAAVEKRGILETAAIRDLRTSRRGELRYDVTL